MGKLSGLQRVLLLVVVVGSQAAEANCSRAIRVPMVPMGQAVVVQPDGRVLGAYPELLRRSGEAGGCRFEIDTMPRARAEMLFQKAAADVLMPASRTPKRDAIAEFVPLMQSRPTLVYVQREGLLPPTNAEALLRSGLRVAMVRGYDYGPAYKRMEQALQQSGRLVLEPDPVGVARALATGLADATVINMHHLLVPPDVDPRLQNLAERLRSEPLDELGWSDSGVYLSTRSLKPDDRAHLRRLFEQSAGNGLAWQVLGSHYPPGLLEGSMRPKPR